ncbi:hypothetical protein DLAC_06036 [Tieghemostelium lacteum]|uniref:Protein DD3-3 n=1 Tax=Tieghemostelium lacteum TaxID=361077 RepID=A0A151ZHA7_TIELA|nr:hypothetical protein DLAC_06036 [Tieghemostelium lacteum]|eukprot:KYQ93362.1 hypothetical protein DLAC_06036 [Tieghemostelium lacteum]
MKNLVLCLVLLISVNVILADIYGHSPPFSNNRNQEENTNRNNANRLFNSQNNDKGGYCRSDVQLNWYEKSVLPIEWTNQHGCGNDQTTCNVVIQYMCGDEATQPDEERIRDGTTTGQIDNTLASTKDRPQGAAGNEYTFGMHESYYYYQNCTTRQRNQGLFTANQNLGGRTAQFTRQNAGGTRYAFECQEERDYYPYWAPSPWKDIAIFTDDKDLCKYYKDNSQNVKSKYYCNTTTTPAPIDELACTQTAGAKWIEVPSWDIDAPECLEAEWNAVNHLGNSLTTGNPNVYNWSVPHSGMEPCISSGTCNCVLRIRYNISTAEIDGWGDDFIDSKMNLENSPTKTDPNVQVSGKNLTIEMNTNQYGRTFQDRTHTFKIRARPNELKNAKIWNLLVKGKRGNIVQAYPAIEYAFSPHTLKVTKGEYIHFQWVGCDHNPANQAGQGRDKTDRSNMVHIKSLNHNLPMADDDINDDNTFLTDEQRERFAHLDQTGCLDYDALKTKHNNNADDIEEDPQNCMRLNAASQGFDGGVIKMTKRGDYYFMSTRNNNFSNRNQKVHIQVNPVLENWEIGLIVAGGTLFVGIAATSGSLLYAHKNPTSGAASFFSKVPLLNRFV